MSQAYCRVLSRCPDFPGFQHQYGLLWKTNYTNIIAVMQDMATSPEYYNEFVQGQSDAQFMIYIYDRLLARTDDLSGLQHWSQLRDQSANGWKSVVAEILESTEYMTKFGNTQVRARVHILLEMYS